MYTQQTVSAVGGGSSFVSAIVNAIAALSDKITAESSGAFIINNEPVNDTINIDGKYKFVFEQPGAKDRLYATITFSVGNNQIHSFSLNTANNYNDNAIHSLRFSLIENDHIINLKLSAYNTAAEKFDRDYLFVTTNSDTDRFAYAVISNGFVRYAIETDLYKRSDTSDAVKTQSRLNYTASSTGTEVDVTSSKMLLSGTQKVDEISGMFDCSTVTANVVYPCSDGKQYYALNANTLMEV